MCTRSEIQVIDQDGVTKISQYSQWDGYPDGQGLGVFRFLMQPENIQKLKRNLPKCRFLDFKGRDKEFVEAYNNATEKTPEQQAWFDAFQSRDIGSDILQNVATSDRDEILLTENVIEPDDIWIEYRHVVNFQDNTFKIIEGNKDNVIMAFNFEAGLKEEDFHSQHQAYQGLINEDEAPF